MKYLYHMVPKNMNGNILYPLHQLRDIHPEIYSDAAKKYEGREHLLEEKIPLLNCLWNDALHLTAINPSLINKALGYNIKFYEIDIDKLDPKQTVVYLYSNDKGEHDENEFVWFDINKLSEYNTIPERTKKYYKEAVEKGDRPFLFHMIPHILYKGTIDITDSKIVS